MTAGTLVSITGARNFSGRVLATNDVAMIVSVAADISITLRRDPTSVTPDQWRYGGLPVSVRALPQDFAARLAKLERETRPDYMDPRDYIDADEGRD